MEPYLTLGFFLGLHEAFHHFKNRADMFPVLINSVFQSFNRSTRSLCSSKIFRILENTLIIEIFTWIALGLFKTLDSIKIPCSVKA